MDSPAEFTYTKAWQSTVGTSSSKNPCWGFRFSMYPAASNAHLKALRLIFLFVSVWVEIVCQEQSTFSPEKTKRPIQTFLTFLSVECSYRPNSLGSARSER